MAEQNPENEGFRSGDEPADARIGNFKVYGGTPEDRARLAAGDPGMAVELEDFLERTLEDYQHETGQ